MAINYFWNGHIEDRLGLSIPRVALRTVWTGVIEEVCFRWLLFLGGIITVKVMNYIFFGGFWFGIPEWLQLNFFGPIANFFTLGYLTEYLVKPENWAIGAGLLSANALFRDGHMYQGILGFLDIWFFGMLMFWVLFTYGLPVCILVHFLNNLMIYLMVIAGNRLTDR
jgi:hypothetical protein